MDVIWRIHTAARVSSVSINASINVTTSAYMRELICILQEAEKWLREQEAKK